jgi:hypothetical protein
MRFHSFFASLGSHAGHCGLPRGFGSRLLSGRLPGLPSSIFKAVGFGIPPRLFPFMMITPMKNPLESG